MGNNTDAVKQIVRNGVSVDYFDESDPSKTMTPLSAAVQEDSNNVLSYLLDAGADVNKCLEISGEKSNVLIEAIDQGKFSVTKFLLERGAKMWDDGKQILHALTKVKASMPSIYKLLYENLESDLGLGTNAESALIVEVAEKGNKTLSDFLLKHSIIQPEVLEAAMCLAIKASKCGAVRTFLRRGVDPSALRYRHAQCISQADGDLEKHLATAAFSFSHPLFLAMEDPIDDAAVDIVYLLCKSGLNLMKEQILEILQTRLSCCENDGRFAMIMVRAGIDIDIVGPTALEFYTSQGHLAICDQLLDAGADLNVYGAGGKSALQSAASSLEPRRTEQYFIRDEDIIAVIHHLLDRGADVNIPASYVAEGCTALQGAAKSGRSDLVDLLIDAGADAGASPEKSGGWTVLEAAASAFLEFASIFAPNVSDREDRLAQKEEALDFKNRSWVATFQKLLFSGTPCDRTDGIDSHVLHILIRARQLKCLKLALDAGANTESRDKEGMTPLQVAAANHDMEAMQLLVEFKADINAPVSNKEHARTALQASIHHVEYKGYPLTIVHDSEKTILFLLSHGADVNAPAGKNYGRTALQAAVSCEEPSPWLVALLLHYGAQVNAPPAEVGGITALQGAAISGDVQIATLLLDHGAVISEPAAPKKGRTAIEGAAEHKRLAMVKLLLDKDESLPANNGLFSAIKFAEGNHNFEIADLLRAYQAKYDTCQALVSSQNWDPDLLLLSSPNDAHLPLG